MKKNILLTLTVASLVILGSCGDDEETVDPIIGKWELDDATLDIAQSGYTYFEFEGDNNVYGEDSYTFEFFVDATYEREVDNIPNFGNINDEGEWEIDGDELDLDSEDSEIGGVPYSFTIIEVSDEDLILEYEDEFSYWSDALIDQWFEEGVINSSGQFTVETQEEFDSLLNFQDQIDGVVTLEFERD